MSRGIAPAPQPEPPPEAVALPGDADDSTVGDRPAVAQPPEPPQSQWQLIGRRFRRHRLAVYCGYFLIVLLTMGVFAEFFAPYPKGLDNVSHSYCPPQIPRFSLDKGLHAPAVVKRIDPETLKNAFVEAPGVHVPLGFFVVGEPYRLWGLIPLRTRFFGVDREAFEARFAERGVEPTFYLLGADKYGRDLLSRIIAGTRVSLSVGLVGIALTFVLGLVIGGVSGYVGGALDNFIQRSIEVISAFPQLPLWMALAALLPKDWSVLATYFGITVVLSLLGWTGLARVVRGKLLSLREEDYAVAARLVGASHGRIIFRHLIPGFTSHVIVVATLSVPAMILGETSLSFLGIGLRPPVVSWGVLLQDCMSLQVVASYPWLLMPVVLIVLTALALNYLGNWLRDAADPYSKP